MYHCLNLTFQDLYENNSVAHRHNIFKYLNIIFFNILHNIFLLLSITDSGSGESDLNYLIPNIKTM